MSDLPMAPDASHAAVYVRSENPHSRDLQTAACLAYAQDHRLLVDQEHIYIEDTEISDEWYDRPAFALLTQQMFSGKFATILILAPDVLFTTEADWQRFTPTLHTCGVQAVSVSGGRPPTAPPAQPDHGGASASGPAGNTTHPLSGGVSSTPIRFAWPLATTPSMASMSTTAANSPDSGAATTRPLNADMQLIVAPGAEVSTNPVASSVVGPGYSGVRQLATGALATVNQSVQAIAADHAAQLAVRDLAAQTNSHLNGPVGRMVETLVSIVLATGQRLLTYFTITVEMIRPFGGYGPGDVVAFIEGVVGWTIDGLKLSILERIFYLVAALTPFVPARVCVAFYRRIEPWTRTEAKLRSGTANQLHLRSGIAASAGWAFLMSQLPPWLRKSMPDPADARYPRSRPRKIVRLITYYVWLPVLAYFALVVVRAVQVVFTPAFNLGALFEAPTLYHVLLVSDLVPTAEQGLPLLLGLVLVGLILCLAVLTLNQAAGMDRLRERLTLNLRARLPVAHLTMVHHVNDTLWQRNTTISERLRQSYTHVREISLKTAKAIVWNILKWEGAYLAISTALALVAIVCGVALALTGIV